MKFVWRNTAAVNEGEVAECALVLLEYLRQPGELLELPHPWLASVFWKVVYRMVCALNVIPACRAEYTGEILG